LVFVKEKKEGRSWRKRRGTVLEGRKEGRSLKEEKRDGPSESSLRVRLREKKNDIQKRGRS